MTEERKELLRLRLALRRESRVRQFCEDAAGELLEAVESAYALLDKVVCGSMDDEIAEAMEVLAKARKVVSPCTEPTYLGASDD